MSGAAIGYARSNWAALNRYIKAGFLAIDNNASERAVKTVALGRKNRLFAGSEGGDRNAAIPFSVASTCKAQKIDPFAYLRDVLERVCTHPARRVAELAARSLASPSVRFGISPVAG